jgi:DTW domain-containing protein
MPHYSLKTRITIFMQKKELNVISNTGHLIHKILSNSEIRFRGDLNLGPVNSEGVDSADYHNVVLYPSPHAKELNSEYLQAQTKPINLIVPDSNWQIAGKMMRKIPLLTKLPKVILPPGKPSQYRLRSSKRKEGVSTFEAIARALGVMESQGMQQELEYFFDSVIERELWVRGKIKLGEVTGLASN